MLGRHFRAEKGKDKTRTKWQALAKMADHNSKNKGPTKKTPALPRPRDLKPGRVFSDQSEQLFSPSEKDIMLGQRSGLEN